MRNTHYWHIQHDLRSWLTPRRWHRLLAVFLTALYGVIICVGLYTWATGTPTWGFTLAARGPQRCDTTPRCQSWEITSATINTGIDDRFHQGMYICTSGTAPTWTTTDRTRIEHTHLLSFAQQDNCRHPRRLSLAQNTALWSQAMTNLLIALCCAMVAVLITLHATTRQLVPHVVMTLTVLVVAFAWLPIGANNHLLEDADVVFAAYLTPTFLATLLWRLLLPAHERKRVRMQHGSNLILLGGAVALSVTLIATDMAHADALYYLDHYIGIYFLALAFCLSPTLVLLALITHNGRRDYAQILSIAVLIGFVPLLIFGVIPNLLNFPSLIIDGSAASISFIAIPLALAFVILKRNLLRVDSLVRVSVQRGLQVFLLVFAAALVLTGIGLTITLTGEAAIMLFVLLLLFGGLIPLLARCSQEIVETWLFPQVHRYRQIMARKELTVTIPTAEQIASEIIGAAKLAFPLPSAALYVANVESGAFTAVATGSEPVPHAMVLPQHPLLFRLAQGEGVAAEEWVVDDAAANGAALAMDGLREWNLFVPIIIRHDLIAFLAVAPRDDGEPYSRTDRSILHGIAGRQALALDYARIVGDLRASLDQQQVLDQLKDQFIKTAHHELRTPVTSLVGFTYFLEEAVLDVAPLLPAQTFADLHHYAEKVTQNSMLIKRLLESLLQIDPLHLSRMRLFPVQLNMLTSMQATIASMGDAIAHQVTLDCDPFLSVCLDEQALTRIVMNLVLNAHKYAPVNSPIHVRVAMDTLRQEVTLAVQDWGNGIPHDKQEQIFERFVRLEADMNSSVRGSGLGLYLVKELCVAMGGKVMVSSRGIPGAGSIFSVTLPIRAVGSGSPFDQADLAQANL